MPASTMPIPDEEVRAFQDAIAFHLTYSLARRLDEATPRDLFLAVSYAVRQRVVNRMLRTEERYRKSNEKRLYYLSMEFLMGRSLENNLLNLGIHEMARQAMSALRIGLSQATEVEADAALGNGGLGRLAACFLDSLATLGMPGFGYGINYEFGLFRQELENGEQRERPDQWFSRESPWLIERPEEACTIPIYGRIEYVDDGDGKFVSRWVDRRSLVGVPHDMPIVGYGGQTVNVLRLYSARATDEFDMNIFNDGDYYKAVQQKMTSETVSKVLYPSDHFAQGKELRLAQEYFLSACAIHDIVRQYKKTHLDFDDFPNRVAIQLNDTHPAFAITELMRLFVDEHGLPWARAWEISRQTFAYTNHTLMSEALEKWPVTLLGRILPRHMEIIYEINRRFLAEVALRFPDDPDRQTRMSLIEETEPKQVRMAYLSIVGSHSVNGVAALHSELVKTKLVPDFHELWPQKFNNKTNGITQRRWLLEANPGLARLLDDTIGDRWLTDLDRLRDLVPLAGDAAFQERFMAVKRRNKERLTRIIEHATGVSVDPTSLFDVQVKRIHEYKRQLLNVLHVIHRYLLLVDEGQAPSQPRTFIFGGKAAPGYQVAKRIIRLITHVADVVNRDPRCQGLLKVVFLPDYKVTLAEKIIPAADLSEQISTAGKEASGTGNMKLALNGALTIGTLDGANIEIREEVGDENIFIFGLTAPEVETMTRERSYHPWDYYQRSPAIRRVVDTLKSERFSPGDPGAFDLLFHKLLDGGDEYFHLADFEAYVVAQDRVSTVFRDHAAWARMAILNVARIGKFSSDRTIREYAKDIWNIHGTP